MKRLLTVYGPETSTRVWREAISAMPGYEIAFQDYSTSSAGTLHSVPLSSFKPLRRASRTADAILAMSIVAGAAAASVSHTPVVAMGVGDTGTLEVLTLKSRWLAAIVTGRLASIVAPNAAYAAALQAVLPERRVHTIHQPAKKPPYNWSPDRYSPYLLCAGSKRRDLHLLLNAARVVPVEVRLVLDDDGLTRALQGDPSTYPANLVVYGAVSSETYFGLLRGASALIHPLSPSKYPVGLTVLLDAMAMGVPIITTDVSSVTEYQGTGTAAIVPAGDAAAMARCMRRVVTDSGWARSLSDSVRRHTEDVLSPASIGVELAGVFGQLP